MIILDALDYVKEKGYTYIRVSSVYFSEIKSILKAANTNELVYNGLKVISHHETSSTFEQALINIMNLRNAKDKSSKV